MHTQLSLLWIIWNYNFPRTIRLRIYVTTYLRTIFESDSLCNKIKNSTAKHVGVEGCRKNVKHFWNKGSEMF